MKGISFFYRLVGRVGWLLLRESTYCMIYYRLGLSEERSLENLFHSRVCGSVFLKEGIKTLSTKVRRAALIFLSFIWDKLFIKSIMASSLLYICAH
jgi:hypothetical protein